MHGSHLTGREIITIVTLICCTLVSLAAVWRVLDAALVTALVGLIAGVGGVIYKRKTGG